jgi:hypothetical protein
VLSVAPAVDPVAVVRAAVIDVNGARGAVARCGIRGGRYGTWSGPQDALAALRVAGISGVSHVAAFGADVLGGTIRPWRVLCLRHRVGARIREMSRWVQTRPGYCGRGRHSCQV